MGAPSEESFSSSRRSARVVGEVREGDAHSGLCKGGSGGVCTNCSVSRVSLKWFTRSTCLCSSGGSEAGSALFLEACAGSSTRWLRTIGLGARKSTNVFGPAAPSSPRVGTLTRAPGRWGLAACRAAMLCRVARPCARRRGGGSGRCVVRRCVSVQGGGAGDVARAARRG